MDIHLVASILATVLIGILLTYRILHLAANLIEVLLPVLGNLGVLNLFSGLSNRVQASLVNGWLRGNQLTRLNLP